MRFVQISAPTFPLRSKALILESTRHQVPSARQHALWVFPLDCFQRQCRPSATITGTRDGLGNNYSGMAKFAVDLAHAESAVEIVLVWERPGTTTVQPADLAAARAVELEVDALGKTVRAQLLAHSTGVSWISGDD